MSTRSRIILALGALILIGVYFMPIWSITLVAPQYPEGVGMYIWVDQIEGHERHDLQNINIVNHYVGMKPIHQEDFWEFDVAPYVFGALIALGLIAAAIGRRWMLWTWVVVFLLIAIAGLVDFWYWGYEYGHNLDPKAPIKVPGMAYQPPLIGSKQLLNFTASSWPYWGSLFAALSFLGGVAALANEYRDKLKHLLPSKSTSEPESVEA